MGENGENRATGPGYVRTTEAPQKRTGIKCATPCEVLRVCPTRRPGPVKANAHVRIGPVVVTFKVVNGRRGLFVAPPVGQYRGRNGRTRYVRWVKWLDLDLQGRVEQGILDAYAQRLADDGANPPQLPPPKRNRVAQLLEEAAAEVDAPEVCESLLERLTGIVGDPSTSARDVASAGKLLIRIMEVQTDHIGYYIRAHASGVADP